MRVIPLIVAGTALLISACSGPKEVGLSPDVVYVGQTELAPPEEGDLVAANRPYLLGPFDELTIGVFGIEELSNRTVQIDASGQISFPLAGVVEAAGLTSAQLAAELEERLRDSYVRDPQVTVNLEETVSQVVTVGGEVDSPGVYPVVGKMTLLRAVATAGGTTEDSDLDDVIIFRTVGGQRYAGLYDLEAVRRGNYPDPEIYANDIVMVGDSFARAAFSDLISISPLITTPLILLLR
ncbi:polysaccharide export protein [Pacificimonas flava]|uniref:Polysaccharide export protein n=2 Tax=Pacificimonas TaxID=1960290 RepID=A0A219B410_9SPHN|nr:MULTISPECIES: polysaccharide biosynthesis/export family protein [Pacificimonas]MBZ6377442.1 polysaccharide export protein [Pacificimonas aurantium]OWV32856.1 polysaccharide export protein [Pacificimonas flava]